MYCSSCGANVAEGTAFCGSCGRPVIGYSVGGSSVGALSSMHGAGATVAAPYAAAPGAGAYAGFWLRVVAAIIDSLVIGVPLSIVFFATIASMLPALMQMRQAANANPFLFVGVFLPRVLFAVVVALIAGWLYRASMESSSWQATLGKRAMGLYVTDMNGNRVSFGRASGRFFAGRGIGAIVSIYFPVSCILVAFTDKKQALHDIIAGTLVMKRPQS